MQVVSTLKRLTLSGVAILASSVAALATEATSDTWLNVRAGPGAGYDIVDTLHPGETMDVQECQPTGWCRITHSGPNGWVNSEFISPVATGGGGPDCRFQLTIDSSGPHLSIVCGGGGGGGGDGGGGSGAHPPPPPPPSATRACFFVGPNYTGARFCRGPGTTDTLPTPLNDAFSSVQLHGGAQARLCSDPHLGGPCRTISHDTPMLPAMINDRASSVQVLVAAPPPPPVAPVHTQGTLALPATRRANMDTGTLGGPGADILYRNIASGRFLTPLNGARLARGAGTNRGFVGCSGETWSGAPLPFAALSVGTYVCLRTDQGRIGQFRVTSQAGLTMTIQYTIWAN